MYGINKKQIQDIAEAKKIPYLVHFTRATNLESIISKGIYPISRAHDAGVNPEINDPLRLDGHRDGISVSIAFPNSKMFYKYRMENPTIEWTILILHPSILWAKDCAFCKHNAADSKIIYESLSSLKEAQSFIGLYEEVDHLAARSEENLKTFDPTDVQAEVLVFDIIDPTLIRGVVFDSMATKNKHLSIIGDRKEWVHANNKGMFSSRTYARKY